MSIAISLSILGFFKYFGFFVQEAASLLRSMGFEASVPVLQIVLPIGISFYTFQTIGYVVDVYRGKLPATRNVLSYALYVAFFPQLVAGPIERAAHLLPQFERPRVWNTPAFYAGLQLTFWGLFKKIVIADNLAPYVDTVYSNPEPFNGATLMTATIFFAFQIYCDFSGYTDTARGVARTLGFELVRNFDHPYISRNPVEFWRRWHISLSQWFQDYLYFPLAIRAMRRGGWGAKYRAHIVAMTLIGFWHGANWTFVVFGLYWGVAIATYLYLTELMEEREGSRWVELLSSASAALKDLAPLLMFAIACVGWVFFRADSLPAAWHILTSFGSPTGEEVRNPDAAPLWLLWSLIAGLLLIEWLLRNRAALRGRLMGQGAEALAARSVLIAGIVCSYAGSLAGAPQPFIYFQF